MRRLPCPHGALSLILGAAAWLLAPAPSHANDAAMGGRGASVFPLKETRVRMAAEDIVMTRVPDRKTYQDADGKTHAYDAWRWQVEATYTFENPTRADIPLQLGFPETHCDTTHHECTDDGRFKQLRTWVRGHEVRHTVSEAKQVRPDIPAYDRVYLYDVTFKAQETLTIRHTYTYEGGASVEGVMIDYVTQTGSLWSGPIGLARFTVRVPFTPAYLGFKAHQTLKSAGPALHQGRGVYEIIFEMKDWTPKEDFALMTIGLQSGHPGYWPLDQECPTIPEALSGWREQQRQGPEDVRMGLRKTLPTEREWAQAFWAPYAQNLRVCRNAPYAFWGYTFKDKALEAKLYPKKDAMKIRPSSLPFMVQLEPEDDAQRAPWRVITHTLKPHASFDPALLSAEEIFYVKSAKLAQDALAQEKPQTKNSPKNSTKSTTKAKP